MSVTLYYGKPFNVDVNDTLTVSLKGNAYSIFYRYINGLSMKQETFKCNEEIGFAKFVCGTVNNINNTRIRMKQPEVKAFVIKDTYSSKDHINELKSYIKQENLDMKLIVSQE